MNVRDIYLIEKRRLTPAGHRVGDQLSIQEEATINVMQRIVREMKHAAKSDPREQE